jgi:hypothetical protein
MTSSQDSRRSAGGPAVAEFQSDVFPAELREIARRRNVAGQPPISGDADETGEGLGGPAARKGLIGLALSGGGIRSATFSLGAIQALDHCGVFKSIDYLSTVSGGGFIGGAVSSLMNDPAVRPNDASFPLHSGNGANETPAVRHIRNSGHYLAPGGLLDQLRIPAIFLRGLVLNAIALVPILLLFMIATQMYVDWDPEASAPRWVFAFAALLFAFAEVAAKRSWRKWSTRNRVEVWFSVSLLLAIVAALLPWLIRLVNLTKDESWTRLGWWVTDFIASPHWGLAAAILAAVALATTELPATLAKVRATVLLYVVGLAGPVVFFAAYLLMCVAFIEPTWLDNTAYVLERRSTTSALEDLNRSDGPMLPIALSDARPTVPINGRSHTVRLEDGPTQLFEARRVWPDDELDRSRVLCALENHQVPEQLWTAFQNGEDLDEIDSRTRVEAVFPSQSDRRDMEVCLGDPPQSGTWRLTNRDEDRFIVRAEDIYDSDYIRVFWEASGGKPIEASGEQQWAGTEFSTLAHVERAGDNPPRWTLTSAGRAFEIQELYGQIVVSWNLAEELNYDREHPKDQAGPVLRYAFASKSPFTTSVQVQDAPLAAEHGIWYVTGFADHDKPAVVRASLAGGGYQTELRPAFPDWSTYGQELALLAIWLVVFNVILVAINPSAFHRFYRDRLSKAYLIRRARSAVNRRTRRPDDALQAEPWERALESNDQQKLAALNEPGTCAPYHLINACMNLSGSTDSEIRGRNGDFFLFSKHFCGSRLTGYCRTDAMERKDRHMNLGTAVAISGAAASPNAGTATVKQLVFLLTLLNIRMGYWLPHPSRVSLPWYSPRGLSTSVLGAGSTYLLLEATGALSSRRPFVNVSDGAHIENLAIYELLRRHCKVIIAMDGAADPQMRFEDLMRLVMYARVDLGADIDLDLSRLQPQPFEGHAPSEDVAATSPSHFALGRIRYCDGETGWLVYIKATLTGDEDPLMVDYRRYHPEFPHQPTAEQFFDERRFEMYRALGFHSVHHTFNALENPDFACTVSSGEAAEDDDPSSAWLAQARLEILSALGLGPVRQYRREAPHPTVTSWPSGE